MRIISRKSLKLFWSKHEHRDSEQPLRAWFSEAKKAVWKKPQDIKSQYRNASFIGNGRVIFNIAGNKYRLVAAVRFDVGIVFIRFVGTHAHYDTIKAEEV